MIQFNLLPDIKVQYLKSKRRKHTVVLSSVVVGIASVTLFAMLLLIVQGVQKKSLSDLNKDIKSKSSELQSTPDLTKILTVQNQLSTLPSLHDDKPVATRFYDYISQLTPTQAHINQATIDFEQNKMTLIGSADSFATINKYVDTIKFTKFSAESGVKDKSAFSKVVLTTYAINADKATYTIDFNFDPLIFNNTEKVTLSVPQIISTRSNVEQPDALFQQPEGTN